MHVIITRLHGVQSGIIAIFCVAMALICFPAELLAISLPATRDLVVMPGEVGTVEIPLLHPGSENADVSVFLLSASFRSLDDQPSLEKLSPEIASWLSLSSSSLTLAPNTPSSVILSVHPPTGALPQSFAIAVVGAENRKGEIPLSHGAATLVFVNIGEVFPQGSCTAFVQSSSGVAHLTLSNVGGGILYNDGQIVLRGLFGFRLGAASSNPSLHRVMGGKSRTWNVVLPTIPWWAVGSFSYAVNDAQLDTRLCPAIKIEGRWWPLFALGVGVCLAGFVGIRRRIA